MYLCKDYTSIIIQRPMSVFDEDEEEFESLEGDSQWEVGIYHITSLSKSPTLLVHLCFVYT